MPIRIDKKTYPDAPKEILKHNKLGPAFMKHLKRNMADENGLFLLAVIKRKPFSFLYQNFLADGCAKEINLGWNDTKFNFVRDLGDNGTWNDRRWPKVVKDAEKAICYLVKSNYLPDSFPGGSGTQNFWRSQPFREFCVDHALKANVEQVASRLKIRNKKDLMEIYYQKLMGANSRQSMAACEKLIKKEKLAAQMEKTLKDHIMEMRL